MNNIEKNAIRIAELIGYKRTDDGIYVLHDRFTCSQYKLIEGFSSYEGLMPIVFESRRTDSKYFISIGNDYIALDSHINGWINETSVTYNRNSEPELIEAIQLACIKYLELKNG
jgi:hypothetical protein